MTPMLRRIFRTDEVVARHPPVLRHPHKQWAFERAWQAVKPRGVMELTRWAEVRPADELPTSKPQVEVSSRPYDYAGSAEGVWHVNFADPRLFAAYGSSLLAQDELQTLEHPALGSLREALLADGEAALTECDGRATPVLVVGAERCLALATEPDLAAGRPRGLYGNEFARADRRALEEAVTVLDPPSITNLIAMAAPVGRGPYWRAQLERIVFTAFTGFSAASQESRLRWPGRLVEVRTGFWGCGAFGGSRPLMTALQLLAARLAGVDRVRFSAVGRDGVSDFEAGKAVFERVSAAGSLTAAIEQVDDLDFEWAGGDGT